MRAGTRGSGYMFVNGVMLIVNGGAEVWKIVILGNIMLFILYIVWLISLVNH